MAKVIGTIYSAEMMQILEDPRSYTKLTDFTVGCVDCRVDEQGTRKPCLHLAGGEFTPALALSMLRYVRGDVESSNTLAEDMQQAQKLVPGVCHGPKCGAMDTVGVTGLKALMIQPEPIYRTARRWGIPPLEAHGSVLRAWIRNLPIDYGMTSISRDEQLVGDFKPGVIVVTTKPGMVFSAQQRMLEVTGGYGACAFEPWAAGVCAAMITEQKEERIALEAMMNLFGVYALRQLAPYAPVYIR